MTNESQPSMQATVGWSLRGVVHPLTGRGGRHYGQDTRLTVRVAKESPRGRGPLRLLELLLVLFAVVLSSGCGNKGPETKAPGHEAAQAPGSITAESVIAAFKQGDRTGAIEKFVRVDWTRRPLFATDSLLNLSEEQFKEKILALRQAARPGAVPLSKEEQELSEKLMSEIRTLKELVRAVADEAKAAVARGDRATAHRYYTAIRECGQALQSQEFTQLVQLAGKGFVKLADEGLKGLN